MRNYTRCRLAETLPVFFWPVFEKGQKAVGLLYGVGQSAGLANLGHAMPQQFLFGSIIFGNSGIGRKIRWNGKSQDGASLFY